MWVKGKRSAIKGELKADLEEMVDAVRIISDPNDLRYMGEERVGKQDLQHFRALHQLPYETGLGISGHYDEFDIWVKADGTPVRYKATFSAEDKKIGKVTGSMTMDFTKFGGPIKVKAPEDQVVAARRDGRLAAPTGSRLVVRRVALVDALDLQEQGAVTVPPRRGDRALRRWHAPALAVAFDLHVEDDGMTLRGGPACRLGGWKAVELGQDRVAQVLRDRGIAGPRADAGGVRAPGAAVVHVRDQRAARDDRGKQQATKAVSQEGADSGPGAHRQ